MKQLHGLDVAPEEFIPFGGQGEARFLGGVAGALKRAAANSLSVICYPSSALREWFQVEREEAIARKNLYITCGMHAICSRCCCNNSLLPPIHTHQIHTAEKYGVANFDVAAGKQLFFDIYINTYTVGAAAASIGFPGAVELVRACRAAGLKTAVASSAERVKVRGVNHCDHRYR